MAKVVFKKVYTTSPLYRWSQQWHMDYTQSKFNLWIPQSSGTIRKDRGSLPWNSAQRQLHAGLKALECIKIIFRIAKRTPKLDMHKKHITMFKLINKFLCIMYHVLCMTVIQGYHSQLTKSIKLLWIKYSLLIKIQRIFVFFIDWYLVICLVRCFQGNVSYCNCMH